MCGIFGYIGHKSNAPELILNGLKILEYRGYDSFGVAVKKDGKILTDKRIGKIGDTKIMLPEATTGIGHTRWATHGGVTKENAHPHMDCKKRLVVVHNGIVENYKSIKDELIKNGHIFLSDTDTEVIPHLIEENLRHHDLKTAVRMAFNMCQGLSAIVVLDSQSDVIIAAKTGSPLIVGVGADELFIASDVSALSTHCKKAIYLKDSEMVVLDKGVTVYSLKTGEKLNFQTENIEALLGNDSLGSYSHFMIKEIMEQPEVILSAVSDIKDIQKLADLIKKKKKIFFIAAGTAYHAALAGVYFLSQVASIPVKLIVASEFEYSESEINSESLIVAFSQSGETIDVIEPLTKAKAKGATIACVVNTKGSSIYRMSDVVVLLHAGVEKAVASTKAYTAKLSVLLYLASLLINKHNAHTLLEQVSQEEKRLLLPQNVLKVKELSKRLKSDMFMFAIGRGMSYSSALEAALKIKEVSYVHIEGLAGGELKHGSIALIQKGTPCIVFAPKDKTYDSILSNAMEIKSRGGYIIGISPENSDIFDYWIEVKDLGVGSILAQIIPAQLLSYYLALEKGITDPDKPRNLAKSVTVK